MALALAFALSGCKGAVEAPKVNADVSVASPEKHTATSQQAQQQNEQNAGRDSKPVNVNATIADGSILNNALFAVGMGGVLFIVLWFNAKHRHALAMKRRGKA